MSDSTRSPPPTATDAGALLTADEVSELLRGDARRVREGCAAGRYPGAFKDEAGAWHIPLSALPIEARARHLAREVGIVIGRPSSSEFRELPSDEAEALWQRFEGASKKLKERAQRDAEACHFWRLGMAEGRARKDMTAEIGERFGIKKSALYEKLARIDRYDPMHWPALLLGQWTGDGGRRVAWPTAAWKCFLREALTPKCPIRTAWRRTCAEAKRQGWGAIPSYDKAKADYEAIDEDVKVYIKEGETALKARSPTARRDYTSLPLHDTWSMDGRRLDVFCIDRNGKYGKPGRVFRPWIYAYAEVRSRFWLGHALGPDLNSDSVRAGFLAAIKTTGRVVPREIEPDNGREIGARENSGGTPWTRRWRGKEDPNGIIGLFPRLGIEIGWTNVAHGQAKIIERVFGTIAQMLEMRHEFRGAYCGNTPDARPEEWDATTFVEIERMEKLIDQVVTDYNEELGRRGQGMDGKSCHQVYIEQARAPDLAVRTITATQERLCGYSAAGITISKKDGGFTILDSKYWSEGTSKLPPGKGCYALYNPSNLSDAVYVYRGEKRLCEARKVELTPYNSKPAAKEIMRARASYTRDVKAAAKALQELIAAEGAGLEAQLPKLRSGEVMDIATGEIKEKPVMPKSKVVSIVPTRTDLLPTQKSAPTKAEEEMSRRIAELDRQAEERAIDGLRKRAAVRR